MTTAKRRRQKEAVDSFSSWTRLFFVVITPMLYSLQGTDGREAGQARQLGAAFTHAARMAALEKAASGCAAPRPARRACQDGLRAPHARLGARPCLPHLLSSWSVSSMRVVSRASSRFSVATSLVTMPHSLLYFL